MFMGPRNWFQEINSASLCSLAGRYDNPIPPRFLALIDFLKIPALPQSGIKRKAVEWPDPKGLRDIFDVLNPEQQAIFLVSLQC
jgi:hypothetical protein